MRPKKQILIIDHNHERAGQLAWVLRVKGYAVHVSSTFLEFDRERKGQIDLIISVGAVLLQEEMNTLREVCPAQIFLTTGYESDINLPMVALIEQIKVKIARKRGPKSRLRREPRPESLPPANAEAYA